MLRRLPALVALALLAPACSDSTGPAGPARLVFGEELVGELPADGGRASFLLSVEADTRFTIRLVVPGEPIRLRIFDASGDPRGLISAAWDGENDEGAWLQPIIATSDETFRIEVEPHEGTESGEFRLLVTHAEVAPELRPAEIEIGELVEGETIGHPMDIDVFFFDASAGEEINVFLQSLNPANSGGLSGWLRTDFEPGVVLYPGGFGAAPAGGQLSDLAHGRITIPQTGRYRIDIGAGIHHIEGQFTGAYRLLVYPVDRTPESSPAALVPGETLDTESIDDVGDIDEFTLSAEPGSEWLLFVEAQGAPPHAVRARVGPAGELEATDDVGGETLFDNPTGKLVMPAAGRVDITVEGTRHRDGAYRGPYLLHAMKLDRGPEPLDDAFALDEPLDGRIDVPGDVDEYVVDIAEDSVFHFWMSRPEGTRGNKIFAQLFDDAGAEVWALIIPWPYDQPEGSAGETHRPRRRLTAGRYTLRVSGERSDEEGFHGAYTVWLGRVRTLPEAVPPTLAIGDEVRGEAIDPASDLDLFRFSGTTSDTLTLLFSADGTPMNAWARVWGAAAADFGHYETEIALWKELGGAATSESGRFVLPRDGEYIVQVTAGASGADPSEAGGYALAIERISARPETAGTLFVLGDTLRSEALDRLGDLDDFVVRGAPGAEVAASFVWSGGGTGGLSVVDRPADDTLFAGGSSGGWLHTGRLTIPAAGELIARVSEYQWCGAGSCFPVQFVRGSYSLAIHLVDRGPEVNAAAIAVGDVVLGEAVDFPGDVDEFTFAGSAGASLDIHVRVPFGTSSYEGIAASLVNPRTGATLARHVAINPTEELDDEGLHSIVLPETGDWLLRIESAAPRGAHGRYDFAIVPGT